MTSPYLLKAFCKAYREAGTPIGGHSSTPWRWKEGTITWLSAIKRKHYAYTIVKEDIQSAANWLIGPITNEEADTLTINLCTSLGINYLELIDS